MKPYLRILELTLEHFSPILAGTGKESVHLDLRESDDLINVFIGKIGSCKTYIMSHLQPYSTVGTLDVRNSDDHIIKGKDGLKSITYDFNGIEYKFIHKFTWTGTSHTKKSYILKDGVELNPNGNRNTFEEIVELEFGITPSFLRLMRLGPNVVNFIDLKATERKNYIATLLDQTEVYLTLHKYWTQELRKLNTSATVLMNRLNLYGSKTLEEFTDDLVELQDHQLAITQDIEGISQKKLSLEAQTQSILERFSVHTVEEFHKIEERLSSELSELEAEKDRTFGLLETFRNYPPITEVSKEIGKYDSMVHSLSEEIFGLEKTYEENVTVLHQLKDKYQISENSNHLERLRETYQVMLEKENEYKKALNNFNCSYSSAFLSGFTEDLNLMNMLIMEILQYDQDIVKRLFNSDSSAISYAKIQIDILHFRKLKKQKMINNLRFTETYESPNVLFFPPDCPTKTCPFYTSHPSVLLKKIGKKSSFEEEIKAYQTEISDLDIEIYKYSDYPVIYSKIQQLKKYWNTAYPVLKEIGALRQESLFQIVTSHQCDSWYNYDRIVDTIGKLEARDKYMTLMEDMKEIRVELNELEEMKDASVEERIRSLEQEIKKMSSLIEEKERTRTDMETKLKSYNEIYITLSDQSMIESQYQQVLLTIKKVKEEIADFYLKKDTISTNKTITSNLSRNIIEKNAKLDSINGEIEQLRTKMNDLKYTGEELDKVLTEQKWMTYMVDAVSPKKGIPLLMVQMFLESCKDSINDMLYLVCEDNIEILDFDISDTEFRIPYMVNGQRIDDISKASQGQISLVSTIMSFALIQKVGSQQNGNMVYNIPLLDEVDGPLHKNEKTKFIAILLKYLNDIGSKQCFLITHDNDVFTNYPVQVIMTTDEIVDQDNVKRVIHI